MGSGISTPDLDFIQDLAYISGLRGSHGTGVFQGLAEKRTLRYSIIKSHHDVSYFLWFQKNAKNGRHDVLSSVMDNFMMGHVRAATVGQVNDANAHPFDVGRIVGAHNGTLHEDRYKSKSCTDSEKMFMDIQERGLIPVLSELSLGSAYAITMFNKNDRSFTFVRNDKRPLCYAYNTKRRVLYWASERKMLELAAERRDIAIGTIYSFTEKVAYNVRPDDIEANAIPKWRTLSIPSRPPIVDLGEPDDNQTQIVQVPWNPEAPFDVGSPVMEMDNPILGTMAPGSNVIQLNSDERTLNKRRSVTKDAKKRAHKAKSLLASCIHCNQELTLLQQYEGVEIDTDMFVCHPCDVLQRELQEQELKIKARLH